MKQTNLFTKTIKELPKDEVSKNSQLLIKAGFVDKLMSGVYSFLPLGKKVIVKIEEIIRKEMDSIGGQEIEMPVLHPKANWVQTGRWDTLDVLYKLNDLGGGEFALGATHEEIVVPLIRKYVKSYKDLPLSVYQIQKKFRMELRAKSGILRGREFTMKDMYSFHLDETDMDNFYELVSDSYEKIFKAVGIGEQTHKTFASGGSFAKYSHEFQTITSAGEDLVHICEKCGLGINEEIRTETPECPECGNSKFRTEKSIEVGNIFKLRTKYSAPFDLKVQNKNGEQADVLMGCYGIGVERLMGTVVELNNDEKGIIWPKNIAPFHFHLLNLSKKAEDEVIVDKIYNDLSGKGLEVLYDNRKDKSTGEKLVESDLLGLPTQIILSPKTLEKNSVELRNRATRKSEFISLENLSKQFIS